MGDSLRIDDVVAGELVDELVLGVGILILTLKLFCEFRSTSFDGRLVVDDLDLLLCVVDTVLTPLVDDTEVL